MLSAASRLTLSNRNCFFSRGGAKAWGAVQGQVFGVTVRHPGSHPPAPNEVLPLG